MARVSNLKHDTHLAGGYRLDANPERTRQRRYQPRGRAIEADALADVRALLAGRSLARDQLIEHLHRIQDRYGHLSAPHLVALATEIRQAAAQVYELAAV